MEKGDGREHRDGEIYREMKSKKDPRVLHSS